MAYLACSMIVTEAEKELPVLSQKQYSDVS